jgi:hypothetical protein
VADAGFVAGPCERVDVQHGGDVDERRRDGGDRDATPRDRGAALGSTLSTRDDA